MALSKRSQRKVDSIIEHASLLFVRHGFHKVTMESIAQYANVSKVTLYKYFRDKQALYEHIITLGFEEELETVKDIVTDLIPYEDKVKKMFSYHLETSLDRTKPNYDPDIILTPDSMKYVKNHRAKMKRIRQKLYNQARMEEHIADEINDSVMESYVHVILEGLINQERRIRRLTEEELEQLYALLLKSIIHTP